MFHTTPEGFVLDGRPLRVLSGALHYFRVLPEQWPHRLRMLRALGLNTVETYVPWNFHEPRPGTYDFTGMADVGAFLRAAADAGLYAIVRPSPYICAEWENGGLPWWLLTDRSLRLRCSDPRYLAHVDRWYDELIPRLAAHQITRGGNVLMMQVENEYGSYGSDTAYLEHLADGLRARGVDVPLFTSDGPEDFMLQGGTLPGVPATVNFGSRPEEALARLRRHRPGDPPMCMEFWCGWFDHWGETHTVRDAADAAGVLERMLALGASVNLYMAHGGTNFGTWAGANRGGPAHDGAHQPTVTSYDYDAPIDERGAPTAKFWAFREVLARYAGQAGLPGPADVEPPPPVLDPVTVPVDASVPLLDALPLLGTGEVTSAVPPSFEDLGVAHGLVRYRGRLPGPRRAYPLTLAGLGDRAHVYADGEHVATVARDDERPPEIAVPAGGVTLDILVESAGRTNYGPGLGERKGLDGVRHGNQYVHGWTALPVPLDGPLPELPWGTAAAGAGFHRARLDVTEPQDGYLALPGWTKGYVWVNGFCLGRYWDRGPQRTLYLPWPLLRAGRNEIVVLELDGRAPDAVIDVRVEPDLG
ncbi:beta-galactosidase family protein [Streptomyces sp. NPDC006134]|uniref:glycoside hydrolase family 35 protein n=1 Tax=Streptomyces sp. NPDC006134 TaxID=3154467 RepID=UPI0033CF96E5